MTEVSTPASTRRINWTNLVFLLGTFLAAAIGVPWYLATHGFGWPEWLTFFGIWIAGGMSITGGYHRLWSHKTYETVWPVKLFYLIFGAATFQNSVLEWAADHRLHHDHTDDEQDPYNIQKGFWWAHVGWVFFDTEEHIETIIRDLMADPWVAWQRRWYKTIAISVAVGIPALVGVLSGRLLGCMIIGVVLRIVVSHHGTFLINSACHMLGRRPYNREVSARDSGVMAILAFGEGYHNYHHSFPFDYRNGIRAWHVDPAKWLIWGLEKLGLAQGLRRASDLQILRAKAAVQYEGARERVARLVASVRAEKERRIAEAHAKLDKAIADLLRWERQKVRAAAEDLEHRAAAAREVFEHALAEWRAALRDLSRVGPVASF